MGQCLEVYSVAYPALTQVIDSGDDGKRRQISGRFRQRIQGISEHYGWSTQRGEPTIFEAIRHLIMNDERTLADHLMYHQGYKFIVEAHASFLDNSEFCPFRGDYLGDINAQLLDMGSDLDMYTLAWGGAPSTLRIPSRYEDVGTGHWTAEAIASNLAILNRHNDLPTPLLAIRTWLEHAHTHKHILVGFHTI